MASKKLPSWQFYPGDWMKDTELRSVSPAARGMWIDLLCLMFESRRRGFLLVNGTPPTLEQISRMTGFLSIQEASVCLTELETSGVFSRTDPNKDGEALIYCRRMVRDEAKRNTCRENGRNGGNPKLKKSGKQVGNLDNPNSNQSSNPTPNPAGTTSSSTSVKNYVCDDESQVAIFEGQFDPRREEILSAWKERVGKAGLGAAISRRDKATASIVLIDIEAGDYSRDQLFLAMDNLMADQEWRHRYSFHGFVNDLPRWLNRKNEHAGGKSQSQGLQNKPRPPIGSRVREMIIAQGADPDEI